ncbi:MAG TPA: DUF433 domain-containing protein [Thermoanaerobaculia bacterium]|nr:DUF433 domain-containing protein [Thermoanaerobaculia bacterium]
MKEEPGLCWQAVWYPLGVTTVIHRDPEILGGAPVFVGTRVPVQTLLDYLEAGSPLHEFLGDFPSVSRVHAIAVLEEAKEVLVSGARATG